MDLESGYWSIGDIRQSYWYPFQNDRNYRFTLKVTPGSVKYWVDGRLMISYQGELPPPDRIGIGGRAVFSTSFQNIQVHEISANQ